jgi:hypothetical protein
VESADPLAGIHAAITRQDRDGHPGEGWRPEQRLSAAEALALFTRDASHAAFSEALTGTIEPGKRADLTVLDKNPLLCTPAEILDIEVLATLVDGSTIFSSADAPCDFGAPETVSITENR